MEFKNHFDCTDAGKIEAINEYNRLIKYKEQFYFIRLIYSAHPFSEGYWIEIDKKDLSASDYVMLEYDGRALMRNKQINEILGD